MDNNRENPFVGLRPFEAEESLLFFGRNQQTLEILQRLHTHRFVAVVGGSGSGKSSLIKAGVIPYLKAGFLVDDADNWHIVKMRPGRNALHNLIESFCIEFNPNYCLPDDVEKLLEDYKSEGITPLLDFIKENSSTAKNNMFLLVDQFEELFRFSMNQNHTDDAIDFVNLILGLSNQLVFPVYVVLTMRSDYIGDCAQFYGLPEAMNDSQYLVPKLNRQQLKMVIEGPVKLYGKTVAPNLLSKILNDLNLVQDELPLLQHALLRMWEHEQNIDKNEALDINDYKAIGKIENALSNHAQLAFEGLNDSEKGFARLMFKALTTIDDNGRKIRRPLLLSDLEKLTNADRESIMTVINKFIEDNRSFLILQNVSGSDDVNIDISHESLIRQWKTLNIWVDEEADSESIYRGLAKSAILKDNNERDWLDGIELNLAETWRQENSPNAEWAKRFDFDYNSTIDYLDQSIKEHRYIESKKRARTRRIQILMASVIGLLVFMLAAGYWYYNKEKIRTEASIIHLEASNQLISDPTVAYRLEQEANNRSENTLYSSSAAKIKDNYSLYKIIGNFSNLNLVEGDIYNPTSISPNGEYLFVTDTLKGSKSYKIIKDDGSIVKDFQDQTILSSVFTNNNGFIYGNNKGELFQVNVSDGKSNMFYKLDNDEATAIEVRSDNSILIATNKSELLEVDFEGNLVERFTVGMINPETNQVMNPSPLIDIDLSNNGEILLLNNDGRTFFSNQGTYIKPQSIEGGKVLYSDIYNSTEFIGAFGDGTIKILDIEGKILESFRAQKGALNYLSYLDSDEYIISSSKAGEVVIYNKYGKEIQTFYGHEKGIFAHRIINNRKDLITYSYDGTIRKWKLKFNLSTSLQISIENLNPNDAAVKRKVGSISIVDNNLITNVGSKNLLEAIDLSSADRFDFLKENSSCQDFIKDFSVSKSHGKIVTLCDNGNVSTYSLDNSEMQNSFNVNGLAYGFWLTISGESVFIKSRTDNPKLYQLNGSIKFEFVTEHKGISAVAFSDVNQNRVLLTAEGPFLQVLNIENGKIEKTLALPQNSYPSALCYIKNDKVAIGLVNGDILVYNLSSEKVEKKILHLRTFPIKKLSTIADNALLVESAGGVCYILNLKNEEVKKLEDGNSQILAAHFNPEDSKIYTISSNGQLKAWETKSQNNAVIIEDEDIEGLSKEQLRKFNIN